MKIYYVDAENVGIDFLTGKNISVLDKVFVFSNNESIQAECEKFFYIGVTGYPVGKNQADFYMVGHLARLISLLSEKDKGVINFIFCSKDQDLLKALGSQCSLSGIKAFSSYPVANKKAKSNSASKANTGKKNTHKKCAKKGAENQSMESSILECFAQPSKSHDVQVALGLSKPNFTKAINNLIKAGKIKRQSKSSKKWCKV
ncbi:MAG: hypothetical protein ACJAW8_000200 [Oleispira sp.]